MRPVGGGAGSVRQALGLELGDDDGDVVHRHGPLLARRAVHVLQAGAAARAVVRVAASPALTPLPSGGRAAPRGAARTCPQPAAGPPPAAARPQLLRHQLRVQPGLPGRGSLADVAHEALEGLGRIAVGAHTAVPHLLLLAGRRLPLRTPVRTFLGVHGLLRAGRARVHARAVGLTTTILVMG